jgi:IclR family pca regulon transcriptional regulator
MVSQPNKYFLSTLEKGLRVLNLFNEDRSVLSLKEISKLVGTDKTSAYRLVNTLVQLGYLKKDPRSKLLRLGTQSFYMAQSFLLSFDLIQVIRPVIDDIFDDHNLTIDSALLDGDRLFAIYRRQARNTIEFRFPSPERELFNTALGKAVLAFLPQAELLQILGNKPLRRWTKNSITKKKELLTELEKTKERGYSLNNEEIIPGLIAIGAPLFNMKMSRVIGSISFDFVTSGHSVRSIERGYAQVILKWSKKISEMIPDR